MATTINNSMQIQRGNIQPDNAVVKSSWSLPSAVLT
jgi:hypothetical protein